MCRANSARSRVPRCGMGLARADLPETEMLAEEENFAGLAELNRALIGRAGAMDSAAEQWIKEGKQAVKMTRLSCHRFRIERGAAVAECDRLQSGEPVAAAGVAQANRERVADQPAAAVGENRRTVG